MGMGVELWETGEGVSSCCVDARCTGVRYVIGRNSSIIHACEGVLVNCGKNRGGGFRGGYDDNEEELRLFTSVEGHWWFMGGGRGRGGY